MVTVVVAVVVVDVVAVFFALFVSVVALADKPITDITTNRQALFSVRPIAAGNVPISSDMQHGFLRRLAARRVRYSPDYCW